MKKKSIFILLLFGFLIIAQSPVIAGAGDLLRGKLKKIDVLGGLGKPTSVGIFEDTDPIHFNTQINCDMEAFVLSDIPQGAILADRKNNYFGSIIPGALYLESGDGASYVSSHFYLDCGYEDANGVWVPKVLGKDKKFDDDSSDPRTLPKIYYSLDEEPQFVDEGFSVSALSSIQADGYSCIDAKYLCGPECVPPDHSDAGKKQVIKNFRSKVQGLIPVVTDSLTGKGSGVYLIITYKDRTPPWIDKCDDDKFPTIGDSKDKKKQICTGDWFRFDGLTIRENKDDKVNVKIALGKIDDCPRAGSNWTELEDWDNGEVQEVNLQLEEGSTTRRQGILKEVISSPPNYCFGFMRYTVFAQDIGLMSASLKKRVGNLNPGCASIKENRPDICYGLPSDNPYYEDLLTSPGAAKAWPFKENNQSVSVEIAKKMSIEGISGKDRVHEGYIRISDNDLPNILIRLKSAKYGDEKQIFFPPCMPAGELTINDSSNYAFSNGSNQFAYNAFVGDSRNILKECNYREVQNSSKRPYFTIFDLVPSGFMNDKDKMFRDRFLNNIDPAFVNKHFRLEDQSHSDTNSQGISDETLEYNGESQLGKRNGTWKEVVALVENLDDSEVEIQEDVEYELGVWVDDSVKWANSYWDDINKDTCESVNIPIPSGITDGKITIDIPNQSPPYKKVIEFSKSGRNSVVDNSVQDSFRVVFREPTQDVEIKTVDDLITYRFPSITVEASDYARNKRTIKLYFRVKDENAKIKTLQRRHQQY